MADQIDAQNGLVVDPKSRDPFLLSAFVQDDITLVKDRLHLFLGSKFEENSYTGFEVQPSARMLWTPTEGTPFGPASPAVRNPSPPNQSPSVSIAPGLHPQSGIPSELEGRGNPPLHPR